MDNLLSKVSTMEIVEELKSRYNRMFSSSEQKRIVLVGPPGSGKGGLSDRIIERYNVCHVSTGELLRNAIRNETDLGLQAKEQVEKGNLVSDNIVFSLLKEKVTSSECAKGFVMDGYPRNVSQAQGLEDMFKAEAATQGVHTVLHLDCPITMLKERIEGRRIHADSGRTYHVKFYPPKVPGKDDVTGEALIQRKDDKGPIVDHRLKVYAQETEPTISFYRNLKKLCTLDASQSKDELNKQAFAYLDKFNFK